MTEEERKIKNNDKARRYRERHPDRIKAAKAKQRAKPDYAAKNHAYYEDNKDEINAYQREYKLENRAHLYAKDKQWRKDNPDKWHAIQNRYHSKLYRTNENFKLRRRLSCRITKALEYTNSKKAAATPELVGCSIDDLRKHLESTMTEGMAWGLGRPLHIGHIIPCRVFDLSDPEEQKKCFHYSNLKMQWAPDNYKQIKEDLKLKIHNPNNRRYSSGKQLQLKPI